MIMCLCKVWLLTLRVSPLQVFTIAVYTPAQPVSRPWRSHFSSHTIVCSDLIMLVMFFFGKANS